MPVGNVGPLTRYLKECLEDGRFSSWDGWLAAQKLRLKDVSPEDAKQALEVFKGAIFGSDAFRRINLDNPKERARAERFIGRLREIANIDTPTVNQAQDGRKANWINLLAHGAAATTPRVAPQTRQSSADGRLHVDGRALDIDINFPSSELAPILFDLAKNRCANFEPTAKKNLCQQLHRALANYRASEPNKTGRFNRTIARAALVVALGSLREVWDTETIATLESAQTSESNPVIAALMRRAIDPDCANDNGVLDTFTSIVAGTQSIAGFQLNGCSRDFALGAALFAESRVALDNIFDVLELCLGPTGWDDERMLNMSSELATWTEDFGQDAYDYVSFAELATSRLDQLIASQAQQAFTENLCAQSPSLGGYPITPSQARELHGLQPFITNANDLRNLGHMLSDVVQALRPPRRGLSLSWQSEKIQPPRDLEFSVFCRCANLLGKHDGKTSKFSLADLRQMLDVTVTALATRRTELLRGLGRTTPRFGNVRVSNSIAKDLRRLVTDRLATADASVHIEKYLSCIANPSTGKVEGTKRHHLEQTLSGYLAAQSHTRFPDFVGLTLFDSHAGVRPVVLLSGKSLPLCKLAQELGQQVYAAASKAHGTASTHAVRWAMKAKIGLSRVLDTVAEARREGSAVWQLTQQHPNWDRTIDFVAGRGEHEQVVVRFTSPQGEQLSFRIGTDGSPSQVHRSLPTPLYSVSLAVSGALRFSTPAAINRLDVPLAKPYLVGDVIDFPYRDAQAMERQVEGKKFDTRLKNVEAKIVGVTADGRYTIEGTAPDGSSFQTTVRLNRLEALNNPHHIGVHHTSLFGVKIDVDTDPVLRKFIAGADKLIAEILPRGAALAELTPAELAYQEKRCVSELQRYITARMCHPNDSKRSKGSIDYRMLMGESGHKGGSAKNVPFGELIEVGRGMCCHLALLQQLLLERAGIDSRLTFGADNTPGGKFLGFHNWLEVTLADGTRYLSDPTWHDPALALWLEAYGTSRVRQELVQTTSEDYRPFLV